MGKTQHIYIALDSDILRSLVYRDIILKNNPSYDFRECDDNILKYNSGYLNNIIKKVKADEIRFLILPTVFQENRHSEAIVSYMKQYCYFPNINADNYIKKCKNRELLAKLYCEPYEQNGVQYPAPMIQTYNAHLNAVIPNNDAYIMAEATLENSILLINNAKHFIYDNKDPNTNKNRAMGIMSINVANGFCVIDENNKMIIPKPVPLSLFGAICSGDDPLMFVKSDDYTKTRDPQIFE